MLREPQLHSSVKFKAKGWIVFKIFEFFLILYVSVPQILEGIVSSNHMKAGHAFEV